MVVAHSGRPSRKITVKDWKLIQSNMAAETVLFKFNFRNPQGWSKNSSSLLLFLRRFAAQNAAASAEEKGMDKHRERSDSSQSEGEHKCTEMYFKFEKVVIDGIMGRELEYGLIEMWVIHRRHIDSKTLFILKRN